MIKKLRRRLTATFTLFTACILLAVIAYSLYDSLQKQKTENIYVHSATTSEIFNVVAYYDQSSQREILQQIEEQEKVLIMVKKQDSIVYSTEGWSGKTDATELLQSAEKIIEEVKEERASENEEWSLDKILIPELSQDVLQEMEDVDTEIVYSSDDSTRIVYSNYTIYSNTISYAQNIDYDFYNGVSVTGANSDEYTLQAADLVIVPQDYFFAPVEDTQQAEETEDTVEVNLLNQDPADFEPQYQVYIFRDPATENLALLKVVGNYTLLFLGGLVLLFFTNYFLASMAVKPAKKSLQNQTEFIAAASHELRNPLAVIRSSIAAAELCEDKAEAQKYINVVDSEATRMGRLVNDLLLLSGGDTGKWKIQMEKVDVDTLLIETAEQAEMVAKEKNVKIILDLPEEALGEIQGDKDRLHQVLFVLVDNALQYAPAKSKVEISAKKEKNMVKILIADHGKGIADEEKGRVFERFYRSDASHSNKNHFGLGLSVAAELVEMHDGKIMLQDTPQGGATFVVMLPCKNKK